MKKCKVFLTSAMLIAAVAGASTVRAADVDVNGSVVKITKSVDLTDDKVLMPKTSFDFVVEPVTVAP